MDIKPEIYLYNTLSKQKEIFVPINPSRVSFSLCGPTVYDRATIGNFRTYIFGDLLRRVFQYDNYKVKYVQNITDVGHLTSDSDEGEDKMEKGAKKIGKSAWDVADYFIKLYWEDSDKLNISRPDISSRATDPESMADQIYIVKRLRDLGYAYETSDGIYFDTSKQKEYGKLASLDIAGLKEGARVKKNQEKKNITDFALWKFSPIQHNLEQTKRQMEWKSPWGDRMGFPGWHVECSAISIKRLGEPFDIHAGGVDLIPIHHTNEIAQNEALYGHKTVNYWMHGGFVIVDGQRMGKSLGNAYTVKDLEDKGFDPLAFRYLTLTAHYRQPLNFTWESLEQANNAYNKIIKKIAGALEKVETDSDTMGQEFEEKFLEAINDDLNMPRALAVMWEVLDSKNISSQIKYGTLLKFDRIFGLSLEEKIKGKKVELREVITTTLPKEVLKMLEESNQARKNKNWQKSDELRKKLIEMGYEVIDTGTERTVRSILPWS